MARSRPRPSPSSSSDRAVRRLFDRAEIQDTLARYARGVDRGDWELVRSAYHPDACDDHGEYNGNVDGLIEWLARRFSGIDNSTHFLGNCLIEFAAPGRALVETYFVSARLCHPAGDHAKQAGTGDTTCRQSWGRYVDRFERRAGCWRIARRRVVLEAVYVFDVSGGSTSGPATRGRRDRRDPLYQALAEIRKTPRA